MSLPISKRDYELSSGEVISVGVNFRALEIMSQYPGGLNKLKKNMSSLATLDEDSEEYGEGMGRRHECNGLYASCSDCCRRHEMHDGRSYDGDRPVRFRAAHDDLR